MAMLGNQFEQNITNNEKLPKEREFKFFASERIRRDLLFAAKHLIDQSRESDIDTWVFLDRSGRLTSHLLRSYWRKHFPNEKMPQMYFIHYGREKNGLKDDEVIKYKQALVKRFSTKNGKRSVFDGKNVLVIDEYTNSGETATGAKNIVKEVFPQSNKVLATGLMKDFVEDVNYNDNADIDLEPYFSETSALKLYKKATGISMQSAEEVQEIIYLKENVYREILKQLQEKIIDCEIEGEVMDVYFRPDFIIERIIKKTILKYQISSNLQEAVNEAIAEVIENNSSKKYGKLEFNAIIFLLSEYLEDVKYYRKEYVRAAKELRAIGAGDID